MFADDTNGLYHNDGRGNFEDVTRAAKIGVETRYICWGAGIVDLDNDGLPDLFMTSGSVYPQIEKTLPQFPNRGPRVVFRNLGNGSFEELIDEAGPGVAAAHCSRGCAFGDFDSKCQRKHTVDMLSQQQCDFATPLIPGSGTLICQLSPSQPFVKPAFDAGGLNPVRPLLGRDSERHRWPVANRITVKRLYPSPLHRSLHYSRLSLFFPLGHPNVAGALTQVS